MILQGISTLVLINLSIKSSAQQPPIYNANTNINSAHKVDIKGNAIIKKQVNKYYVKKQSLRDEMYTSGLYIPTKILNQYSNLIICLGYSNNNSFGLMESIPLGLLKDTAIFTARRLVIMPGGDGPFGLKFLLKKDRLYVSTTFVDIDGKYVGKMEFNKWEAKKTKISYCHCTEKDNIEIIDENNYVLFNMRYMEPNIIVINGYFVGDNGIQVYNDGDAYGCIRQTPNCKDNAIEKIKKIKKLNSYPIGEN